eukprot:SAG25_NODE_541_length_7061_cov_2.707124_3_plen_129_part_00
MLAGMPFLQTQVAGIYAYGTYAVHAVLAMFRTRPRLHASHINAPLRVQAVPVRGLPLAQVHVLRVPPAPGATGLDGGAGGDAGGAVPVGDGFPLIVTESTDMSPVSLDPFVPLKRSCIEFFGMLTLPE